MQWIVDRRYERCGQYDAGVINDSVKNLYMRNIEKLP